MPIAFSVTFRHSGDLKGFLAEQQRAGAALLPLKEIPSGVAQYALVELQIASDEQRCSLTASVLQVMEGVGLVVQLGDTADADALVAHAPATAEPQPPRVDVVADVDDPSINEEAAAEQRAPYRPAVKGMSPLSWPVERLQVEFPSLSTAEKVRVAKYGKRPARLIVLRQQDKTLHNFLLSNNGVTADEVAVLVGMANADQALLKRVCASPEWLRHTNVVRNLICNPRMPVPDVAKLLRHLPNDELRRLAKTGRVRAAVKREIIRWIERGR